MKKILIILFVLITTNIKAQDNLGYLFIGNFVRSELIKQGAKMDIWCYPLIDSSGSIYACEIPEVRRFIKIEELSEIAGYIVSFDSKLITLEQLKEATIESNIEQKYKDLILSIALIDRNKYRINNDFNLFKQ